MKTEKTMKPKQDLYEWEFGIDWFKDLQSKIAYNEFQADYYERMAEDFNDDLYFRKSERTRACSKAWDLHWYLRHGVKQIKSITRCQDAFCYVCQSLKAQRRFQIYAPILKELEKTYDIYHTVFTVPNVTGARLNWTLDKMYDRYGRLVEYFSGNKFIKGIDFSKYGYRGAVRALEVTTGKKSATKIDDFHPHFHCMFVFDKNAPNMEKVIENSFSFGKYDYVTKKQKITLYSRFEWLLQRIWCLLMLDIKVNMENVLDIYLATDGKYKDGFDVKSDNAEGNYHEIFKYAIKGTYKKDSIFSYEDFCYLENALKNRHVYQTYGCLRQYNFNKCGDISDLKSMEDMLFTRLLSELQAREKPAVVQSCIEEILNDLSGNRKRKQKIRYIGPATLRRAFSTMTDEEKLDCFEKMRQTLLNSYQEQIGDGFVKE